MVKVTELTVQQINASLVDIQNQLSNLNYRLEKTLEEIERLKKK